MRDGKAEILVLSDREAHPDGLGGEAATQAAAAGRTAEMTFIPPMVAVGAVHHHLIKSGLRMRTSIIAETAQAWSTHHMNCLIGYGAHAVHPYLLWRAVRHHYELPKSTKMRKDGTLPDISLENAYTNTRSALEAPHPSPSPSPSPHPNPNPNPSPNPSPNPNPNPDPDPGQAGMLKILSKIGICLLSSYHGAQIFEAIGIGEDVMERSPLPLTPNPDP